MKRFTLCLFFTLLLNNAAMADNNSNNQNKRETHHEGKTLSTTTGTTTGTTTTTYQPAQSTGRLLASNCFQCHATNGTGGFERITGGEASDIYKYTTKTANSSIMAAHAQGYSSAQLTSLIGYLNQIQ